MKKVLFAFIFISSLGLYAQDIEENQGVESIDTLAPKVKRLSVGLKIGVPNIAGLSVEGVTPLLDNRVAAFADFSGFNVADGDTEIGLNYSEFGVNVYFGNKGKGFYAGLGAGNLSTDLTFFEDLEGGGRGKGTTELAIKSTNLKLGIKTGGRIYFRFELGYGVADVPETIVVDLNDNAGNTESQTYRIHGNMEANDETLKIIGLSQSGILVGNFGFGISF